MHRAESVKLNIEMRRRLWGVCVISDRWYVSVRPPVRSSRRGLAPRRRPATDRARQPRGRERVPREDDADAHLALLRISLTFGHPHMIDIRDCDARLPSSGDPNDLYLDELVRLSVILGRVQKTLYT